MIGAPRRSNRALAALVTLCVVLVGWSGCIRAVDDYYSFDPDEHYVNPGVFPGNYRSAESIGSTVLLPRRSSFGDPEIYRVPSTHPHSIVSGQPEAPAESTVYITIAAWLPSNGSAAPAPVLVVASPYFESYNRTMRTAYSDELVAWLLRNYFPLGYAVAVVAVRGTGTSGGCMEYLGPREAADLDQAVRFLATQEWSNGNVAMIGREYDAATPWLVAASGNEFLKTIVPMGGWVDAYGSLYRNGTAEMGAGSEHQSHWYAGVDRANNPPPRPTAVPEPGWPVPTGVWVPQPFVANQREDYQTRQNLLCDEAYRGFAADQYSATYGEPGEETVAFWSARDYRERVLENYDGSVFLIHGLQDWAVDPHNVIPFGSELRANGIEVKEWYGQWGGGTFNPFLGWLGGRPDSLCPKSVAVWITPPCRWDFAETLLHWFEYYLKGNATIDLGPAIQLQDSRGYWRNADSYPPQDAAWSALHLHANGTMDTGSSSETVVRLAPAVDSSAVATPPRNLIELKTEPFAEDTRISGLPQLHVTFEAAGPGGILAGWLFDESGDGKVFARPYRSAREPPVVGHAQMDLRFHQGGDGSSPLVPGERYVARMEFEPLDLLIPKGHRLTLWLLQYPYPDKQDASFPSPVDVVLGDASELRLPIITVDPADVFPVPGARLPDPRYYDWSHIRKPDYPELPPVPREDS